MQARLKLLLYKNELTDIIKLNAALNILYRTEPDYAQAKYASRNNALFREAITEDQVNTLLNILNKQLNWIQLVSNLKLTGSLELDNALPQHTTK